MKATRPLRQLTGLFITSSLLALAAQAQTTLYREAFSHTFTSSSTATLSGWTGYSGNIATVASTDQTNSPGAAATTAVNSIYPGQNAYNDSGVIRFFNNGGARGALVTTEFSFSLGSYTLNSISFQQSNPNTTLSVRAAMNIDGNWYASSTTYANTVTSELTSEFNTKAQLFTLTPSAVTWQAFTLTPSTTLSSISATAVALPTTGTVQGFGFYIDAGPGSTASTNNVMRFDNFTINATAMAIPEPSAYAALIGLVTLGAAFLRRPRRA